MSLITNKIKICLTLLFITSLFLASCGGSGGGGSGDSCDFDISLFTNGKTATTAKNYWQCKGPSQTYNMAFFEDGTGYSSALGAFTWNETGCREAQASSSAGGLTITEIEGSIASGIATFHQTFDDTGENFDNSCILKSVSADISTEETEDESSDLYNYNTDDELVVHKDLSLYIGEYSKDESIIEDTCSNNFFVDKNFEQTTIETISEDNLIVFFGSDEANFEYDDSTPHFTDYDSLYYWFSNDDYTCLIGIASILESGHYQDILNMACTDDSNECGVVFTKNNVSSTKNIKTLKDDIYKNATLKFINNMSNILKTNRVK